MKIKYNGTGFTLITPSPLNFLGIESEVKFTKSKNKLKALIFGRRVSYLLPVSYAEVRELKVQSKINRCKMTLIELYVLHKIDKAIQKHDKKLASRASKITVVYEENNQPEEINNQPPKGILKTEVKAKPKGILKTEVKAKEKRKVSFDDDKKLTSKEAS